LNRERERKKKNKGKRRGFKTGKIGEIEKAGRLRFEEYSISPIKSKQESVAFEV
jgi:hypothetical protein